MLIKCVDMLIIADVVLISINVAIIPIMVSICCRVWLQVAAYTPQAYADRSSSREQNRASIMNMGANLYM